VPGERSPGVFLFSVVDNFDKLMLRLAPNTREAWKTASQLVEPV
jgi:hypothetical protein